MLTRENSVVLLGAHADACCLWRLYIPHFSIKNSAFYCFAARPDFNQISSHDIAVVQRCCTEEQFKFVHVCRQLGIKLVYDLDDDVWDLPPYNPAHGIFTQMKEGFNQCIKMVDVVSVSTKALQKAVRKNVKLINVITNKEIPVIVAENRIDPRLCAKPIKSDRLIVGWAGSSSHIGDLVIVDDAINTLALEHPDVLFQFRGCQLPPEIKQRANVVHEFWSSVAEYCVRFPRWGWHIALAPVTDHPFNASKSCLKSVESGYLGIPCLMSNVEPYWRFCAHDPELKWLLCSVKTQWERKLRDLINDEALRLHYGERMRNVVDQHYSFSKPHEGWQEVIDTAASI